jgi:uncharacterized membrane-anchored protein
MRAARRKRVILGLIVADLFIFGGWITSLEAGLRHDAVKLPVEGFDPRDLLSGHYVRFRLIAEREAAALLPAEVRARGGRASFCVEATEGFAHPVRVRAPGEPCDLVLTGEVSPDGVRFGADRFYVDERRARGVAFVRAGPATYLVATLDGGGSVHAIDLVIEGSSVGRK